MLNKDQYNHDEYNDYYARATQDAEIRSGRQSEGNGKKIAFLLLLLLFIGALAYFVMQMLNSNPEPINTTKAEAAPTTEAAPVAVTQPTSTPTTTAEVTNSVATTTTPTTNNQNDVAKRVTEQVMAQSGANGQAMDPAQLTQIIQAVIAQVNQQQGGADTSAAQSPIESVLEETLSKEDANLLDQAESLQPITETDTNKQASSAEAVDTYNKVIVSETTTSTANDQQSLLDDILAEESPKEATKENSDYTQSITQEVSERTKEMRIWVVKPGDTLGKISKKVYGNVMEYKRIYEANPDILRRPDKIYIGQKLRIPEK